MTVLADARVAPEPTFRSYYGKPVLNKPTWEALDIAGYLFLGGLAGASSTLAAVASLRGNGRLARPLELGAAGAIGLSLVALVHDLGRPARFVNMLRVFKPTSPMSVGSWILSAYAPAAFTAAAGGMVGGAIPVLRAVGPVARAGAGLAGPAVASYTAVLLANTAVPAWHEGRREMPFVFVGSAAGAAGGLGLLAAPVAASGPARRVGVAGGLVEVAMSRLMRRRMGLPAQAYEKGKAGALMKASEALTVAGIAAAAAGRRRRIVSAAAGVCLMVGSACQRFGIFHAGVESAEDPRYTVEPQRARVAAAAGP
ncbi:MAG: NrfD/PsrC family molybdoenzyme membrane anchor subunit [Acidimicrobiales bacterium]